MRRRAGCPGICSCRFACFEPLSSLNVSDIVCLAPLPGAELVSVSVWYGVDSLAWCGLIVACSVKMFAYDTAEEHFD